MGCILLEKITKYNKQTSNKFKNQKSKFESDPISPLTPYPPKGGLPNSMIFRCSPLGIGVKQMKIIEFPAFQSGLKFQTPKRFEIVVFKN
jgi:hypothetical protein